MYLSTDDARSDFFLAAVVYILGPVLFDILVDFTGGLLSNTVGSWILVVLTPLLLISAMPLWLMRYRGEDWGSLLGGTSDAIPLGLALGAPVVVGTLIGDFTAGADPVDAITGTFASPQLVVQRILIWLSLAVLTVFLYRRAEYAFRPISERFETLTQRAAIGTIGAAIVASLLLLVRVQSVGILFAPLGFGAAWFVAQRVVPPKGMGEQWMVYAPLITLALGPLRIFSLLFDPVDFLVGLRTAGMVAGFGLLSIMALSARKGGRLVFTLAIVMALLTSVTVFR